MKDTIKGNEVVTKCDQLKMQATDGKYYLTDVADTELFLSLGKNSHKHNENQYYSSKDVKLNHKIIDVHNYSLINNKLINQAEIEITNPNNITIQLNSLENIGPINTEAKNIWPISEEMSESLVNRELFNVSNASFIFSPPYGGESEGTCMNSIAS